MHLFLFTNTAQRELVSIYAENRQQQLTIFTLLFFGLINLEINYLISRLRKRVDQALILISTIQKFPALILKNLLLNDF